nr:hypothetical protein BaRGS_002265 [Batillaria attramentaria]
MVRVPHNSFDNNNHLLYPLSISVKDGQPRSLLTQASSSGKKNKNSDIVFVFPELHKDELGSEEEEEDENNNYDYDSGRSSEQTIRQAWSSGRLGTSEFYTMADGTPKSQSNVEQSPNQAELDEMAHYKYLRSFSEHMSDPARLMEQLRLKSPNLYARLMEDILSRSTSPQPWSHETSFSSNRRLRRTVSWREGGGEGGDTGDRQPGSVVIRLNCPTLLSVLDLRELLETGVLHGMVEMIFGGAKMRRLTGADRKSLGWRDSRHVADQEEIILRVFSERKLRLVSLRKFSRISGR